MLFRSQVSGTYATSNGAIGVILGTPSAYFVEVRTRQFRQGQFFFDILLEHILYMEFYEYVH